MFEKFTQENKEAPKEESKPVMTAEQQKRTDEFLSEQEKQKEEIEAELTPEQQTEIIQEQLQEVKEQLDNPQVQEAVQQETLSALKRLKEKGKEIKEEVIKWTVTSMIPLALIGGVYLLSPDMPGPKRSSRQSKVDSALDMARDGIQSRGEYERIKSAKYSMEEGYIINVGDNLKIARERASALNKAINEYEKTHPDEKFE